MYEGKTLVPIVCMHRSGSSLTTNVLSELGMSLGPFTMMSAQADNPHGFFESREFLALNKAVQNHAFGFIEDAPESPEAMQRFVDSEGRWPDGVDLPPSLLDRGAELVHGLVASGAVSGFKDPRVPLLWPFWAEVFRRMPGLRVIPVLLLRSPHEIAMSMFMRSKGRIDYCDALDVTAAHYKRMRAILADWPGLLARIRFLPEYFAEDLRAACRLLGLEWNEEVYSRVFDDECKHHEAAVVAHPAQALFEQLAALPAQQFTRENAARIETDALVRQRLLRRNQANTAVELASTQTALSGVRAELSATEAEAERLAAELSGAQTELSAVRVELSATEAEAERLAAELFGVQTELSAARAELSATEAEVRRLAADLHLTKTSRFWRLRELLVKLPVLKLLANRPSPTATPEPVNELLPAIVSPVPSNGVTSFKVLSTKRPEHPERTAHHEPSHGCCHEER